MRKFLLFLLAFVIIMPFIQGQNKTVTGTVVNDEDIPIGKIRLTIEDLPYGDVTKKDGTFKIEKVQSEDIFVVQLKNKKNAKFPLGDCNTLKIIISNDLVTVLRDGVAMEKITAQKKVYNSKESNASNIITAKMIERLHPRTVADAIRMKSPGLNSAPISINSGKNILYYIDGTETTVDNVYSLPIESVESIEINKHGEGYGARGAAGVIIVKLKK